MYVRGMIPLEPDERVLYTVEPDLQGNTIAMGCAIAFGFVLFLLPGLILLLIFFLQREKYKDAQCILTTKRIVVIGWAPRVAPSSSPSLKSRRWPNPALP